MVVQLLMANELWIAFIHLFVMGFTERLNMIYIGHNMKIEYNKTVM